MQASSTEDLVNSSPKKAAEANERKQNVWIISEIPATCTEEILITCLPLQCLQLQVKFLKASTLPSSHLFFLFFSPFCSFLMSSEGWFLKKEEHTQLLKEIEKKLTDSSDARNEINRRFS